MIEKSFLCTDDSKSECCSGVGLKFIYTMIPCTIPYQSTIQCPYATTDFFFQVITFKFPKQNINPQATKHVSCFLC